MICYRAVLSLVLSTALFCIPTAAFSMNGNNAINVTAEGSVESSTEEEKESVTKQETGGSTEENDIDPIWNRGNYMLQDDVKNWARIEIVKKSIQILRTQGKSDEEIKQMMLNDFLINEETLDELLKTGTEGETEDGTISENDTEPIWNRGNYMLQNDMKNWARIEIVKKSIQILRTQEKSDEEIKQMMLNDFLINEEALDELLKAAKK